MASSRSSGSKKRHPTDGHRASSFTRLSRDQYATIAEDTLNIFKASSHGSPRFDLRFSIDNTILYTEDDLSNIDEESSTVSSVLPTIEVRHCTTLQAAQSLAAEVGEDHIGVLNFASAKNPGGGFLKGSNAQEESLARSSAIFPLFYDYHRREKNAIYSPQVTVCKDDNGKLLQSPYHVAVVTSPAPNASVIRDGQAVRDAMSERIKRLLCVFKVHKHDTLVLGAFGCGVFQNDPLEVALTFRMQLQLQMFRNCFNRIVFAILDAGMCQTFERVFNTEDLSGIQQEVASRSLHGLDQKRFGSMREEESSDHEYQDGE